MLDTVVTNSVFKSNPADYALEQLMKGNQRFMNNMRINRNLLQQVQDTKEGQQPYAVIISCMDSRTSPELIFDQGLGDIFSIRIAGNVVTPEIIGSAEYACKVVGAKLIMVLGHHGCGAVKGAVENVKLGHLPTITERIRFSVYKGATLEDVTLNNVKNGMKTLHENSEILNELANDQDIRIVGGIYDIKTGEVAFIGDHHEC